MSGAAGTMTFYWETAAIQKDQISDTCLPSYRIDKRTQSLQSSVTIRSPFGGRGHSLQLSGGFHVRLSPVLATTLKHSNCGVGIAAITLR